MRRVITGVDDDGRSTVVSDGPPPTAFHASATSPLRKIDGASSGTPVPEGEAVVYELWALGADVATGTSDPTVDIDAAVFDAPPGATKWIITEMGPGLFTPMHHTPTIDYAVIVSGDVELGLETGSVQLRAGDTLLVDGVEHSWTAGPDGCTIATVLVGLSD